MSELLQQIVNGLALGGVYALFALSFTILLNFLNIVNLGQASVLTFGACGAYLGVALLGLPSWMAILAAIGTGAVLGVILNAVVFKPLRRVSGSADMALVAGLGALMLLNGLAQVLTKTSVLTLPRSWAMGSISIGDVTIPGFQAFMFGTSAVVAILLLLFFKRTEVGRAMRVVGWNPEAARLLGVPAERMIAYSFAVSGALAGLCGVLVGIAFNYIYFDMGNAYLLKGLAAVIVGGLGSIPGAIIGGVLIGLSEAFAVGYLAASWRDAVTFGILMLVLILRPQGLLGKGEKQQVL